MLQFIAEENDKYSIPEQIQMAIEGGCSWVQLHVPGLPDEEIRQLAAEIIPLCKETSTILTIEDHVELAKELHLHGVHLTKSIVKPAQVRELFGPEAIIGVEVGIASAVVPLKHLDIDYVTFSPMPFERMSENIEAVKNAEIMLPIVARGEFDDKQLPVLMLTGVNGVAMAKTIADASDPVEKTAEILSMLTHK